MVLQRLMRTTNSELTRSNLVLLGLVAVSGIFILQLWNWSPGIPLSLGGDNSFYLMHAENLARGGSFYSNPYLGAPVGQSMYDYPAIGELLNYEMFRVIALVTRSAPLAETLFYFGTFFAVALSSNITCQKLGLTKEISISVSLLFTFLPYHLIKNVQHLMLSNYVAIPLVVFALISIIQIPKPAMSRNREFVLFLVGVVAGGTGIYYAIFSMLIVTTVVMVSVIPKPIRKHGLKLWAIYMVGMFTSIVLSVLPILRFGFKNGFHDFQRSFLEVEYYGLKIANLLRPIKEHRIDFLSHISEKFSPTLIPGEPVEMLGIIGSIGIVLLLTKALATQTGNGKRTDSWQIALLSKVSLLTVLLASVGSLNSILYVLGLQQIRVWSRAAPLIGFCALAACGILLQNRESWQHKSVRVRNSLLVGVMVVGLLDQTSPMFVPNYLDNANRWKKESAFQTTADSYFPKKSMILQLPITNFPENGPQAGMEDYYQAFPFIHGSELRWSYGNIKTRESMFHENARDLNSVELIQYARQTGFVGLHIVRNGLEDDGEKIIATAVDLGAKIIYSKADDVNVLLDISLISLRTQSTNQ